MHPANIKNSEMILGILTLKFQTLKAYAFPLAFNHNNNKLKEVSDKSLKLFFMAGIPLS